MEIGKKDKSESDGDNEFVSENLVNHLKTEIQ
jgi:hypothetical protein